MNAQVITRRRRRTLSASDSIGTVELPQREEEIEHQVCHVLLTFKGKVVGAPKSLCGAQLKREKDAHEISECFRANHDICHICLAKVTRKPGSPPAPSGAKLPQMSR
jgi:hypothetical protein